MHLSLEQSGVLTGMVVGGLSGTWTIIQIRQSFLRRKAEERKELLEIATLEEHRLSNMESSLASLVELTSDHESRLRIVEHK